MDKEINDIDDNVLEEYFKMNGFNLDRRDIENLTRDEGKDIEVDLDKFLEEQGSPIGEYKSKKDKLKEMIAEIKKMKEDIKKEKEKVKEEKENIDDRDEKDTLDEKDGKEELDNDKKEKTDKAKEEEDKDKELAGDDDGRAIEKEGNKKEEKDERQEDLEDKEKDEGKATESKEVDPKQVYLNKVRKLHQLKMIDYRDRIRKADDIAVDKGFITMILLQRQISKERAAYIKTYGEVELIELENDCAIAEARQEKKLLGRMDRELDRGQGLNKRLDDVMFKLEVLEEEMSRNKNIDEVYDDYVSDLQYLNKEKANIMWEINKLNPHVTEKKQDVLKEREAIEKRVSPMNREEYKDKSAYNQAMENKINKMEKNQEGVSKEANEKLAETLDRKIEDTQIRLKENERKIRKYLEAYGKDGKAYPQKERAEMEALIIERHNLQSSIATDTKSKEDLEKNMDNRRKDYGDNLDAKNMREDSLDDSKEMQKDLSSKDVSDEELSSIAKESIVNEPNLKDPDDVREHNEDIVSYVKEQTDKEDDEKQEELENKKGQAKDAKMLGMVAAAGIAYAILDDDEKEPKTSTDEFVSEFRADVADSMDENAAKELLEEPETVVVEEIEQETVDPVRTRKLKP